jgi:tetratricopeptide (TPR) repeat protein
MAGRGSEIPDEERKALLYAEDLARRFPDDPLNHDLLASHYKTLGERAFAEGRHAEAEELCRRALAVAERLTRDQPEWSMFGRNVARNWFVLSALYRDTGRPDESVEARAACVRAGAAADAAADSDPKVRPFDRDMFRMELAMYRYHLGDLLEGAGRSAEAAQHFDKAAAVTGALAERFPDLYHVRVNHAICLGGQAYARYRAGRGVEARELYGRHFRELERLIADFPKRADDVRLRLSGALCVCPVESLRDGPKVLALLEKVHGAEPTSREQQFLRGVARFRAGNPSGSLCALEQGLRGGPSERAQAAFFLAIAHHQLGNGGLAKDFYRRAVADLDPLPTCDLVCLREEVERVLSPEVNRLR